MKTTQYRYYVLALLAVLGAVYFFWPSFSYGVADGRLYYTHRPAPLYTVESQYTNGSLAITKIKFESRPFMNHSTFVYGLIVQPLDKGVPGIVYLPGGGVRKESVLPLVEDIAHEGYAVFTIDQRGIGETGGVYLNPQEDYSVYSQGYEAIQHLAVYDALAAFDVVRTRENVNKNKIGFMGESMGGRYAMIATAVEPRSKGVILISSAGFHIASDPTKAYNEYVLSIDPDSYVASISPRKFFMMHGTNDSVISLVNAQATFNLAKEPKELFIAEGCGHGYCELMHQTLVDDLRKLFS